MKRLLLVVCLLLLPALASATVPEVTARHDYTGNASTTVFAYTFKIADKTHLRVLVGGVAKTVDTDYTVSGVNADGGGSITFITAPASGASVIILRDQPIDQTTVYQQGGGFPANRVERDLDRGVMVDQMLQEQINRSLRYPETHNPTSGQVTLPVPEANKCIGWNASGDLTTSDCSGGGGGGGAGGDVTAVSGTTNEITSTNSGGPIPTISIADVFRITGKSVTAPIKVGTTLPTTCTIGDFFFKSDATAGQNIYACTAADTFTQQAGGGGGGSGDLTDVVGTLNQITVTNGSGPAPTVALAAELDLTSKQLLGQNALVFEGPTNNNVVTTMVITDPTSNRTITIPNADSVTVQPLTCAAGLLVSAIDANGLPACAAPSGGVLDTVTANATVSATSTETTIYSFSVPANSIGSNGTLRFLARGLLSCFSGDTTILRPKFGATTLASKTITCDGADGDINVPWEIAVDLSGDGSTSAQIASVAAAVRSNAAGLGTLFPNNAMYEIGRGTAAIDSTTAQTFSLTSKFGTSDIANTITMEYAILYKVGGSGGAGSGDIDGVTAGAGISGGGASGTVTVTWAPSSYVNNVTLWDSSQASRTLTAGLSGATDPVLTFANNSIEVTTGALTAGAGGSITATAFSDAGMTALAAFNTNGFLVQTSNNVFAGRDMTGVSGEISITNPSGTAGNPLFGIADAFTLAGKTSTIPWKTGTTAPPTCSTGMAFFNTAATAGTNLNLCTSANTGTTISGSGSGTGHQIQEEGSGLTARAGLNFIGAAITATDDSGNNRTNVTLSMSPSSGSVVGTGRTITTNAPLGGGGDLTANLTLTCATCATAGGAASGQVGYFTSSTALTSSSNFGFDGTDMTLGNVATNYQRIISATLTAPRTVTLPDADSVTVTPTTATSNQFLTHITSGGVQTKAQPAFSNISGTATVGQGGTGLTTVAANRLLGTGGSVDAVQAITIGSGLTLSAGTLSATGGVGTPGGSDTQLQFNDSGAFLGTSDFTVDKNNITMTVGVEVVDYDNSPLVTIDHDGTWGSVSTAGTGTGAGNVGLKLTTEGTGKLRISSLASTGAAGGKTVVCADANGDLYRSSTGTDCSN